jgi:hypothetical protein
MKYGHSVPSDMMHDVSNRNPVPAKILTYGGMAALECLLRKD